MEQYNSQRLYSATDILRAYSERSSEVTAINTCLYHTY